MNYRRREIDMTVALALLAERSNEGSDSVSDLCSTAGANSFLPSIVVYRHGLNLEVNMNVASGLNIHTVSPRNYLWNFLSNLHQALLFISRQ